MNNFFFKNSLAHIFLCMVSFMIGTSSFAFTPTSALVSTPKIEEVQKTKKQIRAERKIQHKNKRLKKRIEKISKQEKKSKKGLGLLIAGLIVLLIGVVILASAAKTGLIVAISRVILGVPITVGGLVLLIVAAFHAD